MGTHARSRSLRRNHPCTRLTSSPWPLRRLAASRRAIAARARRARFDGPALNSGRRWTTSSPPRKNGSDFFRYDFHDLTSIGQARSALAAFTTATGECTSRPNPHSRAAPRLYASPPSNSHYAPSCARGSCDLLSQAHAESATHSCLGLAAASALGRASERRAAAGGRWGRPLSMCAHLW